MAGFGNEVNKEICRFITCGSVDDGKSTLIGRLLYDTKSIFSDQLDDLQKDSKKFGTQKDDLDFALLVDGLSSERQQGITIDVAYRFFLSNKRKFIIADTPGHEQYTRNMATGASLADIAIVLIDATKGVLNQTKRHSYIVSLMGIKNVILVVNKMDLVNYDKDIFDKICKDYREVIPNLPNKITTHFIPISALKGENIVSKSQNLSWYSNLSLLELLDFIPIVSKNKDNFVLPVQYVNRPDSNFRAFLGNIASGNINLNDEVIVLPSMQKSSIKYINTVNNTDLSKERQDNGVQTATTGQSVSIMLNDEIDINRGIIVASLKHDLIIGNSIKSFVIWMNETSLSLNEKYLIKINHNILEIKIDTIYFKKDINTFKELNANNAELNDIISCNIVTDRNIVATKYENNKSLGSFLIIDKYTNETLAAGMIDEIHATQQKQIIYTQAEKELNAFIRKNYPEWECKKI